MYLNLGILNAINILKCSNYLGSIFRQLRIFPNVPLNISRVFGNEIVFILFQYTEQEINKSENKKGPETYLEAHQPAHLAGPAQQPLHAAASPSQRGEQVLDGEHRSLPRHLSACLPSPAPA